MQGEIISATVITDASHCYKQKVGGWAAWVRVDGLAHPVRKSGQLRGTVETAHGAEMMAAINGVHVAWALGAWSILVQTDCMTVVSMIEGITAAGTPVKGAMPKLWEQLWEEAGLPPHLNLRARHVRGHTLATDPRSYVNRWCHDNALRHMRQARNRNQKKPAQAVVESHP